MIRVLESGHLSLIYSGFNKDQIHPFAFFLIALCCGLSLVLSVWPVTKPSIFQVKMTSQKHRTGELLR